MLINDVIDFADHLGRSSSPIRKDSNAIKACAGLRRRKPLSSPPCTENAQVRFAFAMPLISLIPVHSCLFCEGTFPEVADLYAHIMDIHGSEQRLSVTTDSMFHLQSVFISSDVA
jgi:hypothetical protein